MIYTLIGALLALLVAQRWDHNKQVKAERAHSSSLIEQVRELTNQIVLLKVDPVQATVYAAPEPTREDELRSLIGDDSPAADEAWAQIVEGSRS